MIEIREAKIAYLVERGAKVRGVVHVGTNWGEEIPYYLSICDKIIGFEPLRSAWQRCCLLFSDQIKQKKLQIFNLALGNIDAFAIFHETVGTKPEDSGGSSFLRELNPSEHIFIKDHTKVELQRASTFFAQNLDIDLADYNTLVIDVQGMELDVLLGLGDRLAYFDYLCVECSEPPLYESEPHAQEVVDWLIARGFVVDIGVTGHDDILMHREKK